MFFVLIIEDSGIPGQLFGPMSWEDSLEKATSLVCQIAQQEGDSVDPKEIMETVENHGSYSEFGVYVLQAE